MHVAGHEPNNYVTPLRRGRCGGVRPVIGVDTEGRVSGTGSVGALDVFQGTGQVLFLEDADGAVAGVAYERDPSRSGVAVTAESLALGLIKLAYLVDLVDVGRCARSKRR